MALKAASLNTAFFLYSIFSTHTLDPAYALYFKHLFLLLVLLAFVSELYSKAGNPVENLGKLFLSVSYVGLPLGLSAQLPFIGGTYHAALILSLLILIWTNDTFAYLIGRCWGRIKLFERISPNKTVEGFVGGLASTLSAAKVLSVYIPLVRYPHWMVLGGGVAVFGTLGDLVESMFKREFSVKDTGKVLPGHGGFLDRLDSFLLVVPIAYLYIQCTLA